MCRGSHSPSMIKFQLAALGQGDLHNLRNCCLLPAHDRHAMVEGRDESRVHSQETATLAQHLRVERLFHFQFVTTASTGTASRGLES